MPIATGHSNGVSNPNTPGIDGHGTDPIVITGFSLKFPDEATSSEGFWDMLKNKKCATRDFPLSRLNAEGFLHKENRMSAFTVKGGHFIKEDLAGFDAEFFSISPAEAMAMDPSQRWLLETAYRALENAGLPLGRVAGTSTGVYTGSFGSDYITQMYRDPDTSPRYASVGVGLSMLANRLSWFFDLRGPSIGLDTACSSGATAFDMACRALKDGSVNMSLVAGCNLTFAPEVYLTMTNLDFLSTSGRCFSFDHRAQGYARGEGIVVLVLKRLSDAIRDGDVVRAVVRSTACNEDGRTLGITQPSGTAQERLIRHTYEIAGLDMSRTRYFEAHGTGTPVGDPREAQAIGLAFRQHRAKHDPLYIGAVKSNIGHLEGASGLAGIVKTILVLEKGIIPPNANFEKLNPKIDSAYLRLKFPEECTPWPSEGLRRASVNSFGYGGANSHVVLDDAYHYMKLRGLKGRHNTIVSPGVTLQNAINGHSNADPESRPALMVWSTADKDGIARMLTSYSAYLKSHEDLPAYKQDQLLSDLAFTLNVRRTHLPWRSYAVVDANKAWAGLQLQASSPVKASLQVPRLGFVFSGQGAQWCGMARELFHYESFSSEMQRAGSYLRSIGCTWDAAEELLKPESESRINEAEVSLTLCTVIQLAMVNLLREFSVVPSAVVGHSSGEIAATYASGYLTQESAWKVAYFRGICSAKLEADTSATAKGSMLAVGASETDLEDRIQRLDKASFSFGLSLACVNSPRSITISGEESLVDTLNAELDEQGVFARKLRVPLAYHSRQMKLIAEAYTSMIGELDSSEGVKWIPMVSSVTGNVIRKDQAAKASYWALNMVSTVRFSQAVTVMCAAKSVVKKLDGSHLMTPVVDHLVEIGPHSVLQGPIKDILKSNPRGSSIDYSSLLKRNVPSLDTFLSAVGQLFSRGYNPDLRAVNESLGRSSESLKIDVPQYPFDHGQRFWHEGRLSRNYRLRERGPSDMIGIRVNDWNPSDARWRHFIRPADMPWVEDHVVHGSMMFPAAGMLVMAIEAVKQVAINSNGGLTGFLFEDVQFLNLIKVGGQAGQEPEVQVSLRERSAAHSEPYWEFNVRTYVDNEWSLNCQGTITAELSDADAEDWEAAKSSEQRRAIMTQFATNARDACTCFVDSQTMYSYLHRQGYGYGPAFQCLEEQKYSHTGAATAKACLFRLPGIENHETLTIHPASLDSIFHLGLTARSVGGSRATDLSIPASIRTLWINNEGLGGPDDAAVTAYSSITQDTNQGFTVSGLATSNDSAAQEQPRLWFEGFELRTIKAKSPEPPTLPNPRQWHMTVSCKPEVTTMSSQKLEEYLRALHPSWPERAGFRRDLDNLVMASLRRLVSQFNLDAVDGSRLDMWHKHYWRWAQYQLESRGSDLPRVNSSASESAKQDSDIERFREQAEKTPVGKIYSLVSSSLVDLFRGQVTPMELYVGTSQFKSLYEFEYQSTGMEQATSLLDLLAHSNPNLKVLEIGGGTGGGTRNFIRALRNQPGSSSGSLRCSKYHFTDISPSYFPALQEEFKDCLSQITFCTLDLDKDFGKQGFGEALYDVILAVDVLHLPSDMVKSLSQIRKTLKPGGRLMMHEIFEPTGWTAGFVFGLFPGWWVGVDGQDGLNRTLGPSITLEQWNSLFQAAGFDGYDTCLRDENSLLTDQNSGWIVASRQKGESLAAQQSAVDGPTKQGLIIVDAQCEKQKDFASKMQKILEGLIGQPPDVLDLTAAAAVLSEGKVSNDAVTISLLNYDPSFLRSKMSEVLWPQLQTLVGLARCQLWVSIGGSVPHPDTAMIEGLARTLRSEQYGLHLVTLSLETPESMDSLTKIIQQVVDFNSTASGGPRQYEQEYVEMDGILHTRRLAEGRSLKAMVNNLVVPYELSSDVLWRQPSFTVATCSEELGDTPQYVEAVNIQSVYPRKGDSGEGTNVSDGQEDEELTITVRETVLDCADAAVFSSNLSSREGENTQQGLGRFCAGVVTDISANPSSFSLGDRVCLSQPGVYRSQLKALSRDAVLIPQSISYQEACLHIPPMRIALKALLGVGRVERGDQVLVHDGMTPIGQAAIHALTHLGISDFWVTVTDKIESDWIGDVLGVPRERIIPKIWFSKRAMLVSHLTGRFDLVIQADFLGPEQLLSRVIKDSGRYITFGVSSSSSLSLGTSRSTIAATPPNMRFSTVYLDQLSNDEGVKVETIPKPAMSLAMEVVSSLSTQKKLSSPSQSQVTYFPASDLRGIFDHLHRLKKTEHLQVKFDNMDTVQVHLHVRPPQILDSTGTFLIVGGLGGLGRAIARWMVSRGARSLILLSRSGPKNNPNALVLLDELRARQIKVQTPQCDATNRENLVAALQNCSRELPSIKGCVIASMVLKERLFHRMTLEDWDAVIQSKVAVSWNLHELLPKGLDFFILLSSLAGIVGRASLSAYNAGNVYQDQLAHYRNMLGERATSFSLGGIVDEGYLAQHSDRMAGFLRIDQTELVHTKEVLAMLDIHCDTRSQALTTDNTGKSLQHIIGVRPPAHWKNEFEMPFTMAQPFWGHMHHLLESAEAPTTTSAVTYKKPFEAIREAMSAVLNPGEAATIATEALLQRVSTTLAIPKERLDLRKPLVSYGIDSLAAMDLRNWIGTVFNVDITIFNIQGGASIVDIAQIISKGVLY